MGDKLSEAVNKISEATGPQLSKLSDTIGSALDKPVQPESGDYIKDGLLYCGKCHKPKQARIKWFKGKTKIVPVICDCDKAEEKREVKERKRWEYERTVKHLIHNGFIDRRYFKETFAADDRHDSQISDFCRNYVKDWKKNEQEHNGILLYGSVGTGKTFYASCIVNALLRRGILSCLINLPDIISRIQNEDFGEKGSTLKQLNEFRLIALDDFGTQRLTSFGLEQTFEIIDARCQTGKPMIATTNFSPAQLRADQSLDQQRINDRLLSICNLPVKFTGASRR